MDENAFTLASEGKTKKIWRSKADPSLCFVVSTDHMTAGDGAREAVFAGKGELSTKVSSNVFRYLARCHPGIPQAFIKQVSPTIFASAYCDMLPLEIVGRFKAGAKSSYLKRFPDVPAGAEFPKPVVELFLKTSGRQYRTYQLPCDDPYIRPFKTARGYEVYLPNKPLRLDNRLLRVSQEELGLKEGELPDVLRLAYDLGLALRGMWKSVGTELEDFKCEVGRDQKGNILLADVLDHDSWRIMRSGVDLSKQPFRDGAPEDVVMEGFRLATLLSERFPA